MKLINIICLLVFILFGCQSNTSFNYSNSTLLPNASGENNEMLIVMDSTKFKGEIGRLLVGTYGSYIYGLPQPENNFDLIFIRPRNFNSILKYAKNIVVIFSLEGNSLDSKILRKEFNKLDVKKKRELFKTGLLKVRFYLNYIKYEKINKEGKETDLDKYVYKRSENFPYYLNIKFNDETIKKLEKVKQTEIENSKLAEDDRDYQIEDLEMYEDSEIDFSIDFEDDDQDENY